MSFSRCLATVPVALAGRAARVYSSVSATAGRDRGQQPTRASSPPRARCDMQYVAEERGAPYTPDYRVYFRDEEGPISPLHDIPLWAEAGEGAAPGRLVHMVVEVPRWTNAKMEIALGEPLNPIRQDSKRGALRYVSNVFPHRGYIWNYGALPQTWEDPRRAHPATGARGDNDPVDVLELADGVAPRGAVRPVRVLGALALLDEGETDWKLLAVPALDPAAARLRSLADVEAHCPGLLRASVEWLRLYKVPDGKPPNRFAFDGRFQDQEFAYKIIDEVHESWKALVSGSESDIKDIDRTNVTVEGSPYRVERSAAAAVVARAPPLAPAAPLPAAADRVHYVASL